MEDLQRLVDRLGRELSRGVGIEDPRFRHITHSAHLGDVDWLRSEAILNRETPAAARAWFRTFGIENVIDWVRIPANPDMDFEARVCVPLRFQNQLLGHLWIIEREKLSEAELLAARQAADEAGVILHRMRLTQQVEHGLEREGVRDLLDDSPAVRQQAATHLVESDLVRSGVRVAALVCTNARGLFDDSLRATVDTVFSRLRTSFDRRDMLYLIRADHAVALLAFGEIGKQVRPLEVAGRLRARLERAGDGTPGGDMVVAVGAVRSTLAEALESYHEALSAVEIAHAFPSLGTVVSWDDLGAYRLLSQLAKAGLDRRVLHRGVVTLLDDVHADERLRLLEVYLDLGCDAAATASVLGVHRASVYARLAKIEQVAGISLGDGLDRLAVHMSVKLIRLAGPST